MAAATAAAADEGDADDGDNSAAAGGKAGQAASHQRSPFSSDPNMTFIEMATEHRRVVDFLCQACHRVRRHSIKANVV